VAAKAAREASEILLRKLGKDVAEEGAERLAGRIAAAAARHGDDVINAVRKAGPKALGLLDEAGEQAPRVVKLLAKHGDEAAVVLSKPGGMALLSSLGEEAVETLIRHPNVAEPLLAHFGKPALDALGKLEPRNGRRLAMLFEGGDLARTGGAKELVDVMARFGDKACEFIWKNKGALAVGATLTAFVANPEPFLDGTATLAETVGARVAEPMIEAVGDNVVQPVVAHTARAAAPGLSAFFIVLGAIGACGLAGLIAGHIQRQRAARAQAPQSSD
jgi:hypothetical protein